MHSGQGSPQVPPDQLASPAVTIKQHILHLELDADNSYTAGQLPFPPAGTQEPLYIGGVPGNLVMTSTPCCPMSALNISLLTRQMRYSSPRVIGRAAVDCAGGNGEGLCCSSWGHPAAAMGTFHGSPGHIAAASSCPTPVIYKPLVKGCLDQEARYQQRIRKGAEELASPLQALSFPGELLSFVGPGWGSQAG